MSNKVEVVGTTPDGVFVVTGVFKMFDTIGLPLDMIFDLCKERNWVPSWKHFYDDARDNGWSHKTIQNRLLANVEAVYGIEYAKHVIKVLQEYSDIL